MHFVDGKKSKGAAVSSWRSIGKSHQLWNFEAADDGGKLAMHTVGGFKSNFFFFSSTYKKFADNRYLVSPIASIKYQVQNENLC